MVLVDSTGILLGAYLESASLEQAKMLTLLLVSFAIYLV